jgi:hypothetical protein
MAALTPAKPDFLDVTSVGKIRVWKRPVFATGDTVLVPGIKQVFMVTTAKTGTITFTSSDAGHGKGVVLTLTVAASSTGDYNPLVVYGQ